MATNSSWAIGIDIGGTFTDVVMVDQGGKLVTAKAPTTPTDASLGVIDALEAAAQRVDTDLTSLLSETTRITHGSTIATNTLLVRSGARVGLITTRGFEDTPFIMRAIGRVDGVAQENIRHLMALTKPEPLVDHACIRGVTERIDARGEIVIPANLADIEEAAEYLIETEKVESIAICLLNSWANPVHEQEIASYIARQHKDQELYVSVSSSQVRLAGEYARMNTVLVDAYVGPQVKRYVNRLERRLAELGFEGSFLIMQGNGGLTRSEQCTGVGTLQSGPVGGMMAAAYMADLLGHDNVLTADMGGTSFDVGIYSERYWRYAEEPIFDRYRILQPIVEVESIGAGGGTISRVDPVSGRLVVGPESAGARPGPVSYGEGGKISTVTDADVVLGVIDPSFFLGGRKSLDATQAVRVMSDEIAVPLSMSVEGAADGIRKIIDGKMADLIRRQVIKSGHLPEDFVLYAFGGAAAAHAAGFARELGIRHIYIFPTSPVFSAFGIAQADVRHTRLKTTPFALPCDPEAINQSLDQIEEELVNLMYEEGFESGTFELKRYFSLRFRRQVVNVEIPSPWDRLTFERTNELTELFTSRYEVLYGEGSGNVAAGVELSGIRVDAIGKIVKPSLPMATGVGSGNAPKKGAREISVGGSGVLASVYDWTQLVSGQVIAGPGIVESEFTTVLVPADVEATVDAYGNLVLDMG